MTKIDRAATIILAVILLGCMAYACAQAWRVMSASHALTVTGIGILGVYLWARFLWWIRQDVGGKR